MDVRPSGSPLQLAETESSTRPIRRPGTVHDPDPLPSPLITLFVFDEFSTLPVDKHAN